MFELRNPIPIGFDVQIIEKPVELLAVATVKGESITRAGPSTDEPTFEMALQIEH
jgi:hypothetical protein